MLFKAALVLLVAWPVAWLLGSMGVHSIGQPVHMLLLVGMMLMLLAVARARDAAVGHGTRAPIGKPRADRRR